MGEAKRRREAAHTILPNGICLTRNRPTERGRQLGAFLAEMADEGEPVRRLQFPAAQPRCQSCAFTTGTLPNGCPETVIDAVGCVVENTPFMCHVRFDEDGHPQDLCAGWDFAMASRRADLFREACGGKLPFELPANGEAAKAYLDEERRKLRARKAAP